MQWKAKQSNDSRAARPRLQQMRICSSTTAVITEIKKPVTFRKPQVDRNLQQNTLAFTANPEMRSGNGRVLTAYT